MEPLIVRVEDTASGTATDYAFMRSPVRLGRSARNDLCLCQSFVSAWHGVIDFDEAGVRYTDLGSTNGTLLDGARLPAQSAVAVSPRSEIAIGPVRVRVQPRKGSDGRTQADSALRAGGDLDGRRPSTGPGPAEPPGPAPEAVDRRPSPASGPPEPPGPPPPEPAGSRPPEPLVSAPAPEQTPVAPGGMTAVMRKLAAAPVEDYERAWRRVLRPGAVIGRFELVGELGRGSFGIVFEAKDRQLGRRVALKAVKPGRGSQVMFGQELLQREAEAAAQLNHPNIVSLHDAGTCESGPYLIMELLRGQTLRDRMKAGPIPLDEALEIAIEIAWALDHAHAAGVVHRDLKPANVFLCDSGHVKVLDFGIAYLFGAGARTAVGTPAYMAPEQWRQGPQDARTDIFGAAAMLAEMVTGQLPYEVEEDWSAALEPGARPSVAAPQAPASLAALLRRALSPDPDQRPKDGHAWLAALLEVHERFQAAQPIDAPEEEEPSQEPPEAPAEVEDEPAGDQVPPGPRLGAVVSIAVALVLAASALAYLLVGWR